MSATSCGDGTPAAASLTKAVAPKKNTVDYIPSKLSYDTVIPVSILVDQSDFMEKCKPYDIIDGPNPLDEPEVMEVTQSRTQAAPVLPAPQVIQGERSPGRGTRKGTRSAVNVEKSHAVRQQRDGEEGKDQRAAVFTRPSQSGWAKERLVERRPYQLVRSHDMETRVRYPLDDADYVWCERHNVAPENLQRGVTYLEWAYVSLLLKAAMPHVAGPKDSAAAVNGSALTSSGDGLHSSTFYSSSEGAAATGNGKQTTPRQRSGKVKTPGGDVAVCLCGLCSKPVHLLTSQPRFSAVEFSADGASTGGGHSQRISALEPSSLVQSTKRSFSNVSARVPLPSVDIHQRGLRCSGCGVVAHLRCWFFSEPPKLPEAWTCDGCTVCARLRKRSAGVCCVCGRTGGVLLPYVSLAVRDDGDPAEPQPPHMSVSHGVSTSMGALTDMVCHAVCALTIPELSIHHQETVLRRNGLVDMQMRPFVYALRRVSKQKYAMNCEFCQRASGRCVQCSHPHCFEAMHASCAAEAHTVDCHAESPFLSKASSARTPVGGLVSSGTTSPVGAGRSLNSSLAVIVSWTSCSPYCKKHYGYSVRNSIGSAALGHKAEAEALALDLTGLLTGSDGVTSPMVRKRGRGRPPAAVVKQREVERELISKIRTYWLERREQRRQSSAQLASEINARLRPVVEASLRPEIVKTSAEKVRLSHFLSLVPEWQGQLVAIVEGELPLPDEEYDDVQTYRKVARTRRSGNTRSLYGKMSECAVQLDLVCQVAEAMKEQCRLRRAAIEEELVALRILSGWQ